MNRIRITFAALSVLSLFTLTAVAQQQGGHRPPPPEAVEACRGLKAGDACSFDAPDGNTVEGTCFTPDQSKPLACRPSQPPPGGREQNQGRRSTLPWEE